MRNLLPAAVAPRMDEIAATLNRRARRQWGAAGGGRKTARDLVASLYGATFDGKAAYSALDVHLFSFSTHVNDSPFDREHGIQSQWETYAGLDGYCLVFDIEALAHALSREMDRQYWTRIGLDPVRYNDRPVEELFPELVNAAADTFRQFIQGVRAPEMAVPEFLEGATLLKGEAFKSEREVRIVAIPGTVELAKHAAKRYPEEFDTTKPLPTVQTRLDGRSYIALFEGSGERLPIKRVIVGSGAGKETRAEIARAYLPNVPVTISACCLR